jgi:hypothetical protein
MTAAPTDFWSTAAPYFAVAVSFIAAVIAFVTAWVSHSAKISEFRQKWIDDLRKDTAEYIGAAEKWIRAWDESNLIDSHEKGKREREEAFPLANSAHVILWRIKLRLNPRENKYKIEDDAFLRQLLDLLDPGKLAPDNFYASWLKMAGAAVEQGREILKREWEVTKKFPPVRWFARARPAVSYPKAR